MATRTLKIQITTAGSTVGPFDVYHTAITTPNRIATGVTRQQLVNGYYIDVDTLYNVLFIKSTGKCSTEDSFVYSIVPTPAPTAAPTAAPVTPSPTAAPTAAPVTPAPVTPSPTPSPVSAPTGGYPSPTISCQFYQINGGGCGGYVQYTECDGSYQNYYVNPYQNFNVCVRGFITTGGGCVYVTSYGFSCTL